MDTDEAKELLRATITDMVLDLFVYDRKNDEELTREIFEGLRADGTFSNEFLMECFKEAIEAQP